MINIVKRDFFKYLGKPNTICFWTGNLTVTSRGRAVMGAGLAKELVSRYDSIKVDTGRILSQYTTSKVVKDKFNNSVSIQEHLGCVPVYPGLLSMFPVKYGYWEKADLEVIKKSAESLRRVAESRPTKHIVVNFPGIGAGGLKYTDVYKVIEHILDVYNITVLIK